MRLGDHRLTLFFFALTLATMLVMRQYLPAELAIPLPGSDIRPVLLLEFVSKHDHLVHILGEIGDPLRDARIAGMHTGNVLDYLPSFVARFGKLGLVGLQRGNGAA